MIKSEKIGCFSDIHIGIYQDNPIWHEISLNFAKWASEYYLSQGINDIIISGDVFHNRSQISVTTLSVAKQFFDYFKDFNVYVLVGNHDCFYKDKSSINSISIFDGWKNISIIEDEPFILNYNTKKIALVPWGTEFANIPKVDVIFGHFEIVSFYMNNYKVCDHGFTSENLFEKSSAIISGHFHKKDFREYKNGHILYLGSPYQQNYGDVGDPRGIYIYNLNDNTFSFKENVYSPKHIKLKLSEILAGNVKSDSLKQVIPNNHISLIIDSKIKENQILILKSKLQKFEPKTFRLEYIEVKGKNINQNSNIAEIDNVNLLDDIEKYVNSLEFENKKEVVSYIKELYNNLNP
jgi:DNA repair exonuclease SbcCD nuclease subunit